MFAMIIGNPRSLFDMVLIISVLVLVTLGTIEGCTVDNPAATLSTATRPSTLTATDFQIIAENFQFNDPMWVPGSNINNNAAGQTTVQGLSGISCDTTRPNTYYTVSDDEGKPRYYTVDAGITTSGLNQLEIRDAGVLFMDNVDPGAEFNPGDIDPEGISFSELFPDSVFWQSEKNGNTNGNFMKGDPNIVRAHLITGFNQDKINFPPRYNSGVAAVGLNTDGGMEALAVNHAGNWILSGTELPLQQDRQTTATLYGQGRIIAFDLQNANAVVGEWVYPIGPTPNGFTRVALTEIAPVAGEAGQWLSMEVAQAQAQPGVYQVNIYKFQLTGATDIKGATPPNIPNNAVPITKTLVQTYNEGDIPNLNLGNFQGMSFGPQFGNTKTVIFVADNGAGEDTQFATANFVL